MGKDEFKLFSFYCWQLKIKTLGQLEKWKQEHQVNSSAEMLAKMAEAYNGNEWAKINGIN